MIKRLFPLYVFLIIIAASSCGDNSSNSSDLPPGFDLTTSECVAEDIRDTTSLSEFSWLCVNIDNNNIDIINFLPTTFVPDCFSLESRTNTWCLIVPTERASFTATRSVHLQQLPPRDEDGCRVGELAERIEDLECELVRK